MTTHLDVLHSEIRRLGWRVEFYRTVALLLLVTTLALAALALWHQQILQTAGDQLRTDADALDADQAALAHAERALENQNRMIVSCYGDPNAAAWRAAGSGTK